MNKFIQNPKFVLILAGIGCLAGITILLFFPVAPDTERWKGYRVLTVSLDEDEYSIGERLETQGVDDYITQSNTVIQNRIREAPIQPFLTEINDQRAAWFVDPVRNFRYVYLKNIPFLESKINDAFSDASFFWNLEKTDSITLIPAVILAAFAICGFILVKNRIYQILAGVPIILFSISCNHPAGFIASLLILFCVILIADGCTWNRMLLTRTQQLKRIRQHAVLFVPLTAAALGVFAAGLQTSFLFFVSVCASVSASFIGNAGIGFWENFSERKRLHPVFRMQVMHPDTVTAQFTRKIVIRISSAAIVFSLSGILFFTFRDGSVTGGMKDLYIPSPSGYTSQTGFGIESYTELRNSREELSLPDLTDFLSAQWQIYTFPYTRVQENFLNPVQGSTAEYTDYMIDENGLISPKKNLMNTFNNDFIKKRLSADSTPLEKMLIRQNRFVVVTKSFVQHSGAGSADDAVLMYLLYLVIPGAAIVVRLKK